MNLIEQSQEKIIRLILEGEIVPYVIKCLACSAVLSI